MDIQRYGHATLLVEVGGTRLVIDPGTYSADAVFGLTDVDAIVITHQHADHADPARLPGLLAGAPTALVLAEPSAIAALPALADRATPLTPGLRVDIGGVRVEGVGGQHAVIHPDLPAIGNVGVTVAAVDGGPTLFHPGDAYSTTPDGVDVLAIPLAAPWAKLQETVEFARAVGASTVLPIHDAGLSAQGAPIHRRTVESLGGPARYAWLEPTESLTVE